MRSRRRALRYQLLDLHLQGVQKLRALTGRTFAPLGTDQLLDSVQRPVDSLGLGRRSVLMPPRVLLLLPRDFAERVLDRQFAGGDSWQQLGRLARETVDPLHGRAGDANLGADAV